MRLRNIHVPNLSAFLPGHMIKRPRGICSQVLKFQMGSRGEPCGGKEVTQRSNM